MKPIAAKLLVFATLTILGGSLAPLLSACSDEKSGAPPTSPTAAKQQLGADGGPAEGTGAPPSGGGW